MDERRKGRKIIDLEKGRYVIYFHSSDVVAQDGNFLIEDFLLLGDVVSGVRKRVAASGFELSENYVFLPEAEFNADDEECMVIRRKRPHDTEIAELLIPRCLLSNWGFAFTSENNI